MDLHYYHVKNLKQLWHLRNNIQFIKLSKSDLPVWILVFYISVIILDYLPLVI